MYCVLKFMLLMSKMYKAVWDICSIFSIKLLFVSLNTLIAFVHLIFCLSEILITNYDSAMSNFIMVGS